MGNVNEATSERTQSGVAELPGALRNGQEGSEVISTVRNMSGCSNITAFAHFQNSDNDSVPISSSSFAQVAVNLRFCYSLYIMLISNTRSVPPTLLIYLDCHLQFSKFMMQILLACG